MKLIVTHFNPDEDAMMAVWLIRRFLPGWTKARVEFVPAGGTWEGKPADGDPEILHCDTGGGKYDHHQTDEDTCAAILVSSEVFRDNQKINDLVKKAIERMLVVVNEDDHAKFISWPEPTSDRWDFNFYQALGGMAGNLVADPAKLIETSLTVLDGIFRVFLEKVEAEGIIECGDKFKTAWGEGIAVRSENVEIPLLALKSGLAVAVRIRPRSGHLGIYGNWQKGVNLEKIYQKLKKMDPEANWFLHASGCLILNGTRADPKRKATKIKLEEVVKLLEKGVRLPKK